MKNILIATGIFPPDIGGPALYSQKLAGEFSGMGLKVSVMTYGRNFLRHERVQISGVSRFWPSGIRQFIYFVRLLAAAKKADMILAFDSLGAGLPAVIAGKLFGKKVIIRMGGDFLWERYIESGSGSESLTEFYDKKIYRNYTILFSLIGFTLRSADSVAFTTEFQRDLFILAYGIDLEKAVVIGNVFMKKAAESLSVPRAESKVILWAGRFLKLKNLDFLLDVFSRLFANDKNLTLKMIGDGPEKTRIADAIKRRGLGDKVRLISAMNESLLSEEIIKSYFCILPSLGDISPNFALKCLSMDKPIVLTQETGIKKDFPGLMYADPKNKDSFYLAALRMLDDNSYDNYSRMISGIRYHKTWKDLADEYLKLAGI